MKDFFMALGGSLIVIFWILYLFYDFKKRNERHIDHRGYERDGFGDLVHRRVAFQYLYNSSYPLRFREYDIHHVDGNKRNNHPSNLQILTREEHKIKHGY